jgi:hypothetical protein
MARLTTTQVTKINKMNEAARQSALATRLDKMEYGSIATPSVGTLVPMTAIKYTTTPAIGTATASHAAIAMTDATQTITTSITQPDFPRILTIKGNASGITGNVVLTGTDFNGAALTETIALNGATEVLGTKAFKTLTSIALPVEVHAGTDTVSIGRGDKIGLPVACPDAGLVIVKSFDAGAADAGTVTASATLALSLYAPAGTLNGTKAVDLVILVSAA